RPLLRDPSRQELMRQYLARKDDMTTPQKAELFLIEVPLESRLNGKSLAQADAEEISKARLEAREHLKRALEELQSGIEFEAVAKAYSLGLGRTQGGAIGEI